MNSKSVFKTKLRIGDLVEVIAGKDKGKRGRITEILRKRNRAVVEGINLVNKHRRAHQEGTQGRVFAEEASIHLSNIMIIDPKTDRPTRIGIRVSGTGAEKDKTRISKLSGETIANPKQE